MNFRIIKKNHAADPEIGFLAKSISKSNGCATAMPTAWKLKIDFQIFYKSVKKIPKRFIWKILSPDILQLFKAIRVFLF